FNNNVLNLANGTAIRSEVIVSFGNATASGNSTANVDINGNGQIDSDEAHVRSVPARVAMTVPPQVNGNATPTLSDTLSDIATTGTVTFSDAQFNLGATSGTVTVKVDGGTDGGEITNCAHLTSPGVTVTVGGHTLTDVGALNLQACNTQTIGAKPTCTAGEPGCGWKQGDMRSFSQFNWDAVDPNGGLTGGNLLLTYFDGLYSVLEVGGTHTISFTSASNVLAYLPASGAPAALNATLTDPTSTSAGVFAADVLALKLNIDFSDHKYLAHASSTAFGDLLICGVSPLPDATTIRQLLGTANTLLGGGSVSKYTIAQIDSA